ncbi:MAG: YeeE/YedE family protein [Pseudomonadota bacterium]
MMAMSDAAQAAMAGLFGGVLLGLAAQRGRFCTLGAIEDAVYAHDYNRARMWAVALCVAIAGVFGLEAAGALTLTETAYARHVWNPAASIAGGLMFGYGMAMAGNCGFGALARMAGGEMRSLVVVVVMGVSAYMALVGPLEPLRLALFPPEHAAPLTPPGVAHDAAALLGIAPAAIAALISAAFLSVALASPSFRQAPAMIAWGVCVGIAVTSGWWGTAVLNEASFDATPVESHAFTAALGETLLYLMTSDGGGAGFSIGSVAGVLLGALLGSLWSKRFRWEACDDPRDLRRHIFGAFLMGVGGVIAMGCSIGQGMTAFSVLTWSAPVVVLSIIAGAALGLRHLVEGGPRLPRLAVGGRIKQGSGALERR